MVEVNEPQEEIVITASVVDSIAVKSTATNPGAGNSVVRELRELADMREQGFLSEEEFVAAKANILSK